MVPVPIRARGSIDRSHRVCGVVCASFRGSISVARRTMTLGSYCGASVAAVTPVFVVILVVRTVVVRMVLVFVRVVVVVVWVVVVLIVIFDVILIVRVLVVVLVVIVVLLSLFPSSRVRSARLLFCPSCLFGRPIVPLAQGRHSFAMLSPQPRLLGPAVPSTPWSQSPLTAVVLRRAVLVDGRSAHRSAMVDRADQVLLVRSRNDATRTSSPCEDGGAPRAGHAVAHGRGHG